MQSIRQKILAILLPYILLGCGDNRLDDSDQGYWVSESHGSALQVISNTVFSYEFTDDFCLKTDVEELTKTEFNLRYKQETDGLFVPTYPGIPENEDDYGIHYASVNVLPESCLNGLIDLTSDGNSLDPEENLELFLQIFEEYYFSFESANVDWTTVAQAARSKISSVSTRDEIFSAMSEAISYLQNGHVYILDGDKLARYRRADKPVLIDRLTSEFLQQHSLSPPLTKEDNQKLNEYIEDNESLIQKSIIGYLNYSQLSYAANNNIIWGKHNNIGYLHVASFNDFTTGSDGHAETFIIMHESMSKVLEDFSDTDGIVIDLRFNGGGYAYLAKALVEYFVEKDTTGYIKSAKFAEGFTPEVNIELSPKVPNFVRPVAVLTSNSTSSAAELAVLMLSSLEHVTLIGERTQGMLSGSLPKSLANGFKVGISNMKQLSSERQLFEQEGIPVDIEVSFASMEDRKLGRDSGLDAAFSFLENN